MAKSRTKAREIRFVTVSSGEPALSRTGGTEGKKEDFDLKRKIKTLACPIVSFYIPIV